MTSLDPLTGLMPSRSNTKSSSPTSVGRVWMCQLQSLRTTINHFQTSAKATTHMTFSMLMGVACSTISYKQDHWCDMMTTDMGAKGSSTRSTSPKSLAAQHLGEKWKLTVIGWSAKPTSFRSKEGLCPVRYYHNKRAWTTGAEFDAYLSWLNYKCIAQDRKILLFIDNAPGHVNLEYSNIKLSFLPANTTSHLQWLDAGIITQTKALYKKRMLCEVLCEVKKGTPAQKAAKDIQIYDAIEWLHLAWDWFGPWQHSTLLQQGRLQHVFNKPITDVPEPDLKADVTDDMQSLLDIPFTEFINLKSDEMIHKQHQQSPRNKSQKMMMKFQMTISLIVTAHQHLSFLWMNIWYIWTVFRKRLSNGMMNI